MKTYAFWTENGKITRVERLPDDDVLVGKPDFTVKAETLGEALAWAAVKEIADPQDVVPELMGHAEAGKVLGWRRGKVAQYLNQRTWNFPEPMVRIGNRSFWLKAQIEEFKEDLPYRMMAAGKKPEQ